MEELRQQIRMHQAVRFNTVLEAEDDDNPHHGSSPSPSSTHPHPSGGAHPLLSSSVSLEAALLQKNRHLEHELTMARLRAVDGKTELDAALARLGDLEEQV